MPNTSPGTRYISPMPSLLVSVFLFMMAVGLLNIFLGVRMSMAGIGTGIIGMVMAAFYAGMAAGTLYARNIIAQVGHIRSFTAFAAVTTSSVILHGLFDSMLIWSLLRILTGFALAGLYMVIESWLQEVATTNNRGSLFSLYMLSNYAGIAAGQLMLNFGDPLGAELILIAALLFALCLVPIALTKASHPATIMPPRIALHEFIKQAPLGAIGSFSSGMIISAYLMLAPVFGVLRGMNTTDISLWMAVSMIGGLLLQWPIGKLSDRYDRSVIMSWVALTTVAAAAGLFLSGNVLWLLLLCGAFFGGLAYSIYPISVCHANDRTPDMQFVRTATIMLLLYGCGAILGPILGSLAINLAGPGGLFIYIGLISLILAGSAWRWHRRKPEEEHLTEFMPMPRTTPLASEFDPRTESET
jgi:MFS family permease